ncbi:hypothetical protein FHG87_014871 [Trinorchestia longiramus]|nr:hypothetical protein FHG87_014871 [Trinorchestia longiramus]
MPPSRQCLLARIQASYVQSVPSQSFDFSGSLGPSMLELFCVNMLGIAQTVFVSRLICVNTVHIIQLVSNSLYFLRYKVIRSHIAGPRLFSSNKNNKNNNNNNNNNNKNNNNNDNNNNMAVINSCCCWRTLRRGSYACAFYSMLTLRIPSCGGQKRRCCHARDVPYDCKSWDSIFALRFRAVVQNTVISSENKRCVCVD